MFTEEERRTRGRSARCWTRGSTRSSIRYGFVDDHDVLPHDFTDGATGEPGEENQVCARVGQWIRDTCDAPHDEDCLSYQFEIGRRYHRTGKNETDDVNSVPHIHLRYVIAFVSPITAPIRDFPANGDHDEGTVDAMYHAWFESVVLQVALWSYPSVPEGDR